MKYKLKKNDEVVVISGAHRGKRGKVLEVLRGVSRVIVEGVALRKHSVKRDQKRPEGGVFEKEDSLHYSNVMLASHYEAKRR